MQTTAADLANHFGADENAVTRLVRTIAGDDSITTSTKLLFDAHQSSELLAILAESTAACATCKATFEPRASECNCGRALGRCPSCRRFTSFRLMEKHFLARDDYRCDRCDVDVTTCSYGESSLCERWAGKDGTSWRKYCIACEVDPKRLESDERARAFGEALGHQIAGKLTNELRTSNSYQRALGRIENGVFDTLTGKK